jgi:hypothetical protein
MLAHSEVNTILGLQLLIARAAQKDSLIWWEDDSLTASGRYLLDRLFIINPEEAGRKLAVEAARVRYLAAFGGENNALHLFHLDQTGEIELSLQGIDLSSIPVPADAIKSVEDLRRLLLELVGSPIKYQIVEERSNHRLEIKLGEKSPGPGVLQIVKTLAWAILESKPGKPIFPYIQQVL